MRTARLVRSLEFTCSPRDPWLRSGGHDGDGGWPKSGVRVWDLATGKVIADITIPEKGGPEIDRDRAGDDSGSQDTPRRHAEGGDHRFEIATGRNSHHSAATYQLLDHRPLHSPMGARRSCRLAGIMRSLRWDLATGKPLPDPGGYSGHLRLARSPDGKLIAAADNTGRVELLDAATGQQTAGTPGDPASRNRSESCSRRTVECLATAHWDAGFGVWETETGTTHSRNQGRGAAKGRGIPGSVGWQFGPDGR